MNEGQNGGTGFGTGNFDTLSGNGMPNNMNMGTNMQQGMGMQQPGTGAMSSVGSGQGDIILAAEKKSHKGVIIALILAALIIGGMFAVVYLSSSSLFGGGGASVDAKTAFNRYANYLLYGENSDAELKGEYNENGIYMVYEIKDGDNKINMMAMDGTGAEEYSDVTASDFFAKAETLWGDFYKALDSNATSLVNEANGYREDFELYKLVVLSGDSVGTDAIQYEDNKGNVDAAKKQITTQYADFVKSDYALVKDYGEKAIKYYSLYYENSAGINTAGCVLKDSDVVECANGEYNEVANTIYELLRDLTNEKSNAKKNVASGCWAITGTLNEEGGDE